MMTLICPCGHAAGAHDGGGGSHAAPAQRPKDQQVNPVEEPETKGEVDYEKITGSKIFVGFRAC